METMRGGAGAARSSGRLRARGHEAGFTLIELMVTVLIIGVLISIALPTFLGARTRAQNRSTQADLRNGLSAAEAFYATRRTYIGFTAAVAEGIEPPLVWANAGSPTYPQVRIGGNAPTATSIMLVARSASTRYFCIKRVATGAGAGTFYRSGAGYANVDQFTDCTLPKW